jgi:hypothetical protein
LHLKSFVRIFVIDNNESIERNRISRKIIYLKINIMTKGERIGEHVVELIKDNHLSDLLIRQIATTISNLASYYQTDFYDVVVSDLNFKQLKKIKLISDLMDVNILTKYMSSYCVIEPYKRAELNKWVVAKGGTEVPTPKRKKTNTNKYFNNYNYSYRTF